MAPAVAPQQNLAPAAAPIAAAPAYATPAYAPPAVTYAAPATTYAAPAATYAAPAPTAYATAPAPSAQAQIPDNYGLLRDYAGQNQAYYAGQSGYTGQAQYTYTDPAADYGYPSQTYRAQSSTPVVASAQGQWVYTAQYGWIWIPANAVTYAVQNVPCVYLYTPTYGWTWYTSPWGWGRYSHAAWVGRPWPYAFRAWSRGSTGWSWYGAARSTYYAPHVAVRVSPTRSYGYRSSGWSSPSVHTGYGRSWSGGGVSVHNSGGYYGGTRRVVSSGGRSFDGGGSFRGGHSSGFQHSGGRQFGGGGGRSHGGHRR